MALGKGLGGGMAVADKAIALVVILAILGGFIGIMLANTSSFVENLTDGDTGNDTANLLLPVFALVVALGIIFAIVRRALDAGKL